MVSRIVTFLLLLSCQNNNNATQKILLEYNGISVNMAVFEIQLEKNFGNNISRISHGDRERFFSNVVYSNFLKVVESYENNLNMSSLDNEIFKFNFAMFKDEINEDDSIGFICLFC